MYITDIEINDKMKWNESGFRPPLCTYRLNWARRTSWGWWDDYDDTVLQTQDSKFEPWRSEAEHVTSRSRRLPTILTFTRGWGRNIFCFFETAETGNRTPNSGVKGRVRGSVPGLGGFKSMMLASQPYLIWSSWHFLGCIPSLKPYISFYSNQLAIWHGLPDIRHIKVNNDR